MLCDGTKVCSNEVVFVLKVLENTQLRIYFNVLIGLFSMFIMANNIGSVLRIISTNIISILSAPLLIHVANEGEPKRRIDSLF